RLEKLIQEYLKRYQKCFSQKELDEILEGDPVNQVIKAIAASAKDALLPTMALILATMMSLFERLVLLDIGKRSASSMIKQYGSMIFHNGEFRVSLKKLYEDERSIAQVLEAITYQLLPELEQYADTVNSHYWLSGLKKVYNSVRPQMMTLSDSLYKHGQMAVDYLDKASVYLKDGQKVEIKQKAYLTLLSNIHEFLKQQVQTVPYNAKGEKFEYDTFVQSAIIKKDQITEDVDKQKRALLDKVSKYSKSKEYPLETKMFFYSMLRGGGWSLFSTHPIPSDEFLLSSVDSQLLLLSLLKDADQIVVDTTPPRLPAAVPLFRDLQEQIVTSYQHNNTLDWCFLDLAHQGRRNGQYKLGVINQLVVLLQFLPEDKSPLRVSLRTQINLVQQLILSLKSYEVAEKRKAVAAMLMSCLYFKRDYDLVQPLKEAVLAADDSGSDALDLMLDSFAHSCRYDLSSMPGTMYFMLFSLDQFMSLDSSTLRKLFKLKVQSCGFLNKGRKDFLNSFIESELATNIPLLKNQIDLTVSAIQHDIHTAFIRIKTILSQNKEEMEAIKSNITKVSKTSIKNLKDKIYASDLYQKSRQVFWILRCLDAAGTDSKSGKYKQSRVASFFEFVKKESDQKPVAFVAEANFMWSKEAFDKEEYVPINRIKASQICDKTILKDDYLSPISAALAQLAYPAVYALIRCEVNKLLNLVDYQKGTKRLKLPEENCSTTLAVFLVMMSYIAKVSYVFNARGEADAGRIITTIEKLNLYEFESFFMIYTEYDELYRDLYNSKAQAVSDGNMVQPFDDLNSFTADRDQHFQLLKRLIDEKSFKAQKSQQIDQLYCRNDSYAVSQKQSDGAVVMDVDSKWWVEWKNVDLYDEQALIRLYDDSEWMSKQTTELRIKKLKAYVADFEKALQP
ncbi:MAG: hypothetical protein O2809_04405, partial [Proteobacteria bacterium]|nr:hypothetical protein [Pseudomonadota bacterium]